MLNDLLCSKMPGDADVLRSADVLNNSEDGIKFSIEYLNTLNPNGFPSHSLHLKPGMPLMLLRNLNPKEGLCNGSKLIFERSIDRRVLQCTLAGSNRTVLIPRIVFIPKEKEDTIGWTRTQFPVKPSFSMTVNKSQGKLNPLFLNNQSFSQVKL